MNTQKQVFKKLFKEDLASQKVELSNIKEVESLIDSGFKKHSEAIDLVKKAEIYFQMANKASVSAEKYINEIIKIASDLGLDSSFAKTRLDMIKTLKEKSEKNLKLNYIP